MSLDAEPTPAMRRNAALFASFCRDVETRGGKVTVGLSGKGVSAEKERPNDLVVHVVTSKAGRDPVRLAERVSGQLAETVALLRAQLGMVPS